MAESSKSERRFRPSRSVLNRTLLLMAVCGILLFALLIVQLYRVMILDHGRLEELAVRQQTRDTVISARRGVIYDRNGGILAASTTAYNIFISPYELQKNGVDVDLIARRLPELLPGTDCRSRERILEMAEDTGSWYKTVATRVDTDAANRVRSFISYYDLSGIHVEETTRRCYPNGTLACHILGFVGSDNTGLEGLEAYYDKSLSGVDGSVSRLRTGRGDEMLTGSYEEYSDAIDGSSLHLTLDMSLQSIAERALRQGISDYGCGGGCCIIMDVNTGAIRALASCNPYDPNHYQQLSDETIRMLDELEDPEERAEARREALYAQWRNTAISDTYEPGSVFKIVTLSMALDCGAVNMSSSYSCSGHVNVLGRTSPLKCWRTAGHGLQTLTQAAQHSCNVAFVQIGMSVGATRFYDYIRAYGFFDRTGIDLGGEALGSWWTPQVFTNPDNKSQLAAASFGQTFTITPLQMVTAVSAAVNGGKLMRPYLVESVEAPDGTVTYSADRQPVRRVIGEETSLRVREILEQVVSGTGGTGKNAYVPGYRIGGKTGTSEKVAQQARTGRKDYMVSFCGVAPADKPELAILFILDSPDPACGVYVSGGNMAAPAVGSMYSEILPYLGYAPKYTEEESRFVDVRVPDVTQSTVAEAEKDVRGLGLAVTVIGEGERVTTQLPLPGSEVAAGSCVLLYADEDPSEENVEVPDISAMSAEEAKALLAERGLFLDTSGALPIDSRMVISVQYVPAGSFIPYGSVIRVTLIDSGIEGEY